MVEKAFRKACFSPTTATRNSSIKKKIEVLEVQLYRARESIIAIVKQLQLFVVVGERKQQTQDGEAVVFCNYKKMQIWTFEKTNRKPIRAKWSKMWWEKSFAFCTFTGSISAGVSLTAPLSFESFET
jgi:hypothetical protein